MLRRQVAEVLFSNTNDLLVFDSTSGGENNARGGVVLVNVRTKIRLANGLDVIDRTQDGVAEGVTLERRGVQVIKDNLKWK